MSLRPADLTKLEPIYRIIYCGSCRDTWQMKGVIKVRGKTISRKFTCPSCGRVAKIDYIHNPSYRCVDTREHYMPWYYSEDKWTANKQMLEQI